MSRTSRRVFVAQSAALVPMAKALFAYESFRASNLGVQLYTVRNVIGKDPAATLQAIQKIGYTEIEGIYATLDEIWPALKQTSLQPVSVHIDESIFMKGGSELDSALANVKQRGFQYVVVPYIPVQQRGGVDMFKRLAETLNKSGERAQSHGLKLCYHNHAFEYKPLDGKTGLEMLMNDTEKSLVSLELDIFWASVAGHDPVELLKTYSGRVLLLHLKDKSRTFTNTQYNENVPHETFKEVGSGSVDIPAVLKAADTAGVQHYFVEQDQTPGDPIESLRKSFEYLETQFNK
ncbi:MAG: sugar phosphate isomerase/epimerase [Acidobacteriota bacterium]|nr:sugar phosphate isomerase/epimerase [Acidobacteriota bacterium]